MVTKQGAWKLTLNSTPSSGLNLLRGSRHTFGSWLWFFMSLRQTNQLVFIHLPWPGFFQVSLAGKIHIWVWLSLGCRNEVHVVIYSSGVY